MADPGARELKLTQYLNEAYGKEKQLETVLETQIGLAKAAARKPLQKRFQDHLKETKAQARGLERRIKQLGGKAEAVNLPGPDVVSDAASGAASLANKALAAAKGPVQALRGTSPADNLLRNVRDAVWNEAEEIAHYDAIEALADTLNDKDTAKMAREFRRQEERMQKFLRSQISALVKQVVRDEVPARERRGTNGGSATRSASSRSTSAKRKAAGAKGGRKSPASASSRSSSKSTTAKRKAAGAKGGRKSSATSSSRSTTRKTAAAKGARKSSAASSRSTARKSSGSTTRKSSGSTTRKSSGSTARKRGGSSSRRSSS